MKNKTAEGHPKSNLQRTNDIRSQALSGNQAEDRGGHDTTKWTLNQSHSIHSSARNNI